MSKVTILDHELKQKMGTTLTESDTNLSQVNKKIEETFGPKSGVVATESNGEIKVRRLLKD